MTRAGHPGSTSAAILRPGSRADTTQHCELFRLDDVG